MALNFGFWLCSEAEAAFFAGVLAGATCPNAKLLANKKRNKIPIHFFITPPFEGYLNPWYFESLPQGGQQKQHAKSSLVHLPAKRRLPRKVIMRTSTEAPSSTSCCISRSTSVR